VSATDWVTATATIAAAVAAGASVVAAFKSTGATSKAAQASRDAADAAATLTRIEEARRLRELQPVFEAKIVRRKHGDTVLLFTLVGPAAATVLDRVRIRTRTDGIDWTEKTPAEHCGRITEFPWGPGQFRIGIDESVSATQSRDFIDVEQGTELLVSVEASVAPPWWTPEAWNGRYQAQPMRLAFECKHGEDEWIAHLNVRAAALRPQSFGMIY